MVILTDGTGKVSVFKFKSTGVVALCQEVTEYVASTQPSLDRIDLSTARFEETDTEIMVSFDSLPKED